LPYARALQYLHASLWANGAWTVKTIPAAADAYDKLLAISLQTNHDEDDDF